MLRPLPYIPIIEGYNADDLSVEITLITSKNIKKIYEKQNGRNNAKIKMTAEKILK